MGRLELVDETKGFVAVAVRHAVLEDDGLHSQGVQPSRDLGAFLIPSQFSVTSAGTNDDAGPGRLIGRSRKMKEFGSINVGDPDDPVGTRGGLRFLCLDSRRFVGRFTRPDANRVTYLG